MRCRECGQDLGHDGDYRDRLCAECSWYALDADKEDDE